jgi:hypothetical protein
MSIGMSEIYELEDSPRPSKVRDCSENVVGLIMSVFSFYSPCSRYIPVGDAPPGWEEDNILIARHRVHEARKLVVDTCNNVSASTAICAIQ